MKKLLMILMMFSTMLVAVESYAGDMVNVNTATVEQLQSVKGIGEKTALAIVAYRTEHGDFKKIEELTSVKGLGDKKIEKVKSMLTTGKQKK